MSCPTLATLWTVAHQTSLSMGFPRQEYRSGLPFPPPGDLPDPVIEPRSPALQADSLPTEPPGKPTDHSIYCQFPARDSTLKPKDAELGREISSIICHPGVWWRKKGVSIWAELIILHLFSSFSQFSKAFNFPGSTPPKSRHLRLKNIYIYLFYLACMVAQ